MVQIFKFQDILEKVHEETYPLELIVHLMNDFFIIKVWSDFDKEYSYLTFDARIE